MSGLLKIFSAVFCLLLVILTTGCSSRSQPSVFRKGRMDYIEGEVTLNGTRARLDQEIEDKSTVETGAESLCDLIFNQKNIVHIGENSLFKVDVARDPGAIELSQGSILMIAKKLIALKDSDDLMVRSPTTVLGVRGTSFFVKVEDESSTYLCICNGSLHSTDSEGGNPLELTAPHHRAVRYMQKDGSIVVEDAELLYHGDSDVEKIAEKIGVVIDWTKAD